jgi:hypothetical protein
MVRATGMVGIKELGIGEKGEMRVGDEGRVGR